MGKRPPAPHQCSVLSLMVALNAYGLIVVPLDDVGATPYGFAGYTPRGVSGHTIDGFLDLPTVRRVLADLLNSLPAE